MQQRHLSEISEMYREHVSYRELCIVIRSYRETSVSLQPQGCHGQGKKSGK